MAQNKDRYLSTWFRLAGFLPLILFLARLSYFLGIGEPSYILWICHISTLMLAAGLFLEQPELVRVSVLWLVIGIPLWIWDMAGFGIGTITTFGTHIGGLIVGLIALWRVGSGQRSWLYAVIWFLIVQQVCRMVTPAELNVNIAHGIYRGWEAMFNNYRLFWSITTVLAGIVLFGIGKVFLKLFPPRS